MSLGQIGQATDIEKPKLWVKKLTYMGHRYKWFSEDFVRKDKEMDKILH